MTDKEMGVWTEGEVKDFFVAVAGDRLAALSTLADAARRADQDGRRQEVEVLEGGLCNGRTEKRLTVLGVLEEHAVVTQGLTSEAIFVPMVDAAKVIVAESRRAPS